MQNRFEPKSIRTAAILTGSYVAGTVLNDVETYNQLVLFIDFTKGSLDSCEIKLEFHDGVDYFQQTVWNESAGSATGTLVVNQITATGKYILYVPIKCSKVKVSAKGTGTVTSSSLAIRAAVGDA